MNQHEPVEIRLKEKYRRGWKKGKFRSDYNGNSGIARRRGSLPQGFRRKKQRSKGGFGHI